MVHSSYYPYPNTHRYFFDKKLNKNHQKNSGALRHFGFRVIYSTKNHHAEVVTYIKSFVNSISAIITSDKYFLFNSLISSNVDILDGSKFRIDHESGTVRATRIDRFHLKREMCFSHQQPLAFLALTGNHILKLNEIINIVDPVYLRVSLMVFIITISLFFYSRCQRSAANMKCSFGA